MKIKQIEYKRGLKLNYILEYLVVRKEKEMIDITAGEIMIGLTQKIGLPLTLAILISIQIVLIYNDSIISLLEEDFND